MEGNEHLILDSSGNVPKNWQTESIIMLVLTVISCSCFALPTAIIGLVFATKVERQYHQGFQREANSSANTAKILFIVSACLLVFSFIIGIGMNILGMILEN